MNKILHLTNHVGTIKNFNSVCRYLGLSEDLTNESWAYMGYTDENAANHIWKKYKDKIHQYDTLLFTDTAMVARPFLQNIEEHNCKIIIYITTRFNWGVPDSDIKFYELFYKTSRHPRVTLCADNEYDQFFTKIGRMRMLLDSPIKPTPYLHPINIMPKRDELFFWNRSQYHTYFTKFLNQKNIRYEHFGEGYSPSAPENLFGRRSHRDEAHICEFKGLLHTPYQVNIQGLWENLGYGIIYFLPSPEMMERLVHTEWYYWQERYAMFNGQSLLGKSLELAEWYFKDNKDLFIYFNDLDELKHISETITADQLAEKKAYISEFMKSSNKKNIEKWRKLLT